VRQQIDILRAIGVGRAVAREIQKDDVIFVWSLEKAPERPIDIAERRGLVDQLVDFLEPSAGFRADGVAELERVAYSRFHDA
jgi:hypothetical protein